MLDSFLKVACSRSEREENQARLTEKMRQLPEETLLKIASGEEKLAYMGNLSCEGGGGSESWLDKFKGTPLFEQALELEKQDLQEQMAERARWREEDQLRSARNAMRDEISVQRKLLELQLAEVESGIGEPELPQEMPEEMLMQEPEAQAAPQEQPQQPQPAQPSAPKEESPEKAAMKLAYAMIKMGMDPLKAKGIISGDVNKAISKYDVDPEEVEMATPGIAGILAERHNELQGKAQFAQQHPVLNRMKGIVPGALAGGAAGALLGGAARAPLKGVGMLAGAGAGLGGLAGGMMTPSAEDRAQTAQDYGEAMGAADLPMQVLLASKKRQMEQDHGRAVQLASAGAPSMTQVNYDEGKMAAAMLKTAIGLGMLGTAAMGAAKSIGGGAAKAFQSARGFGSSIPQAARMGAGAAMGQAPGALNTLGRAATSYAKANPLQAAGIAGAAGLGAGYALG